MAGGRYRRRRPGEEFAVPLNQRKGPPLGPEILPWWWHPEREGAQPPPAAFAARLKEIDPELGVCFSPVHERWLIWVRNPRIQHPLCRGWQLLFLWEHPVTKEFLPLNELVFHNLYYISAERWPGAVGYFERIQADIAKQKAALEKDHQNDRRDYQRDFRNSLQISTAGRGNRAAMHHSGTIVPSPGEAAWRAETRKHTVSAEVLRNERDAKEKRHYE